MGNYDELFSESFFTIADEGRLPTISRQDMYDRMWYILVDNHCEPVEATQFVDSALAKLWPVDNKQASHGDYDDMIAKCFFAMAKEEDRSSISRQDLYDEFFTMLVERDKVEPLCAVEIADKVVNQYWPVGNKL